MHSQSEKLLPPKPPPEKRKQDEEENSPCSRSLYRVILAYSPKCEGEIALDVGEVISTVKELGNGWALGRNSARSGDGENAVGILPSVCIERIKTFVKSSSTPEDHLSSNNDVLSDVRGERDVVASKVTFYPG